ncbi:hypothetical protein IL306_008623 [Fusarium sp. DS 682]|nr:hypothetical protein IL306_008623 [Fusarium sp. DS 682]
MAESLAKLKNLKALHLDRYLGSTTDGSPLLAKLSNLEQICIEDGSFATITSDDENSFQKLLLNCLPTLQTLEVRTSKYYSNFLADWEDQIKARNPDAMKQEHDFTALKSLSLHGMAFAGQFCEKVMPNLTRAFDFLKLRELTLIRLEDGQLTFFKYLQDLFGKADKRDIHLRRLCVEMKGAKYESSYAETEVFLEGMYRFISSFDTLTNLEIHEYNMYNKVTQSNPGLSRRLLQSILKHPELETLRFHHRYTGNGPWEVPLVSPETVNILVKDLPHLKVFEFSPEEDNLDAMARALSCAKNLTALLCPYYLSFYEDRKNAQLNLTKKLVEALMEIASGDEKFIWEEHYKLNRITVGWIDYGVGSGLKPKKGFEKPVKIKKGNRVVMVRDLKDMNKARSSQVYHRADTRWVDRVAQPIQPQDPLQPMFDGW